MICNRDQVHFDGKNIMITCAAEIKLKARFVFPQTSSLYQSSENETFPSPLLKVTHSVSEEEKPSTLSIQL